MDNSNYYNSQQGWQNSWDPDYYSGSAGQTVPPPPPPPANANKQTYAYKPQPYQPPTQSNWPINTEYPAYSNNVQNYPPLPAPTPAQNHQIIPPTNKNSAKKFGKMTFKNPNEGKGKIAPYQLPKPSQITNKPAYTQVAAQKNIFAPPKPRNVLDSHNANASSLPSNLTKDASSIIPNTTTSNSNSSGIMPPTMKSWFSKLFEICPHPFRHHLHETSAKVILQIIQDGKQFSLNWEQTSFPKFNTHDSAETVSQKFSDHLNQYLYPESVNSHSSTNTSSVLSNSYSNQPPNINSQPSSTPATLNTKFQKNSKKNANQQQKSEKKKGGKHNTNTFNSSEFNSHKNNANSKFDNKGTRPSTKLSHDISQMRIQNYSSPPPVEEAEFIGTNTTIEKRYLRLTTAPVAANVRPLYILEQTFELLKNKQKDSATYSYLCDQYKSMRQDLQVQRIRTKFTVQVYEAHARLAIIAGDMGEYNSCQTQLRELYELVDCENLPEFTAYRILYFIFTRNFPQLNQLMSKLPLALKQQHSVQHAFSIYTSMANNNHIRLFKLYQQSPNLSKQMMNQFIERERISALISILKSTLPQMKVPLNTLVKLLQFDSLEEIREFLEKCECKLDAKDSNMLLGLESNQTPLVKANQKYQVVDIKGQI